ncbi:MAG: hypothetical protein WC586_07690 [Methanoregula sp.]
MKASAGILITISLLLLAGTAGAAGIPDTLLVSTDTLWLAANNADQSVITITLTNTTPGYNGEVPGVTVNLAVDPLYGTLSPATVITDPSGRASSTFRTSTRSGAPQITAATADPVLSNSTIQNIDHDALTPAFTPATGVVGEVIPFRVSITDQWGNPIDNRRSDDTVSLSVTCPLPNDCSFVGYGHSYSSHPDSNGNLNIPLQLGTRTGVTSIVMNPVQDIGEHEAFITTSAGEPVSLTREISPSIVPPYSIPTVPVGTGVFYFRYTLLDSFGNPVKDQSLSIHTSLGEDLPFETTTNALGQTPILSYGPKGTVSNIIITATVVDTSLTDQFEVAFTTAEPKDMVLSVTPQTLASLEYESASQADVVARVLDTFGNPVSGQEITFTLGFTRGTNWNADPTLASFSGTTDNEGKVKTVFFPGSFNGTEYTEGSCLLTAVWTSKPSYPPKTATLTWMNHPYLSVYTSVSNENPVAGDLIDVTIRVVGNGKANTYLPITVMLDQDTSSSMKNPSDTVGTREQAASAAATVFIDKMDASNTQMGLETFGWDQNDPTIGHMDIPSEFSLVKEHLALLGGLGSSKQMESSIVTSFNKIISATSTPAHHDDIKALILLSDGGSNLDNHGALDSLVSTANANGIHVYTISYLNGHGDSSNAYEEMEELANRTGGKHYSDMTSAGLNDIYLDIAKRIQILAGANTTMTVSFNNIVVNNTVMTDSEVFDYIPVGPFSPLQTTVDPGGRTSIIWTNGSQTVRNQSAEWPQLKFDVGSIEIGQTWLTTFRLRVKPLGNFNIFGGESTISYNGGSVNLVLPDAPITVKSDLLDHGLVTGTLAIENLRAGSSSGPYTDFIPLQWNTRYNSLTGTNHVTEYVYYRIAGGPWNQFDIKSAPAGDSSQTTTFDVRNLPSGTYDLMVHGHPVAGDAYDADSNQLTVVIGGSGSRNTYIKLQ